MKIYEILPNTFIDYPGKIACVLFTPGCNMRCWYCHNHEIISDSKGKFSESAVLNFLEERKGFLEAVVISGGEPTLQKDLIDFIKKIKKLNYLVKLDTNGFDLKAIEKLAKEKLIDYVAVDIKAPYYKYKQICGVDKTETELKQLVSFIQNLGIDFEFRTTFSPDLEMKDIMAIAKMLNVSDKYFLQQYRKNCNSEKDAHSEEYVINVLKNVENVLPNVKVRGLSIDF